MTTDQHPVPQTVEPGYRTTSFGSMVRASLTWTLGVGVVILLVAALFGGASAARGVGIAVAMVCLFFATGALVLRVVTRLAPAASLLIALLTYTLKIVLVGQVFLSLDRSGALAGSVDGQWLGGTVIAVTLVWTTVQIVCSLRARQLLYDLPSHAKTANVG